MVSLNAWALDMLFRLAMKRPARKHGLDIGRSRRAPMKSALRIPEGMSVSEMTTPDGLTVDIADRAPARTNPPDVVVYYLHGGGYFFGSPKTHRQIIIALAKTFGGPACAPDYRLAPEHPFPAAVDDAVNGYRWLRAKHPAAKVVIAGDSAGGGLALATMLRARDAGLPLPAAFIGYSAWTDLAVTGASIEANARRCAMFTPDGIRAAAKLYTGDTDPKHPHISPLYADLHGLPPMQLFVSRSETLHDDTVRFAARARAAGVEVELIERDGLMHVWPIFVRLLPEGREALIDVARFGRNRGLIAECE